ncbi:hypothetical protein HPP92_021950 [Vanilla planifolia]|uniref:Major facilitator superfamily (MFS) profile domain-containing protein n=1 Tax=Vanilla planifolia TaxID=51239 RepID=A0A835PN75_VANPL|nr:hypothetical protein HPP92_022254 [Vanilla planifolia]KAG0457100.1 hypothetical protein HPP92_022257 [Vanilla planifolia]KAG0458819.1 hypothetical protein HPP92_021947 [Vanilla planifolia]KAG0458822.1 hypothetical protein HPP92_021950 [Vanilla planifolia]
MKDLKGLGHLFVCVFLYHFAGFVVAPAITDVTMEALCPGTDQCSLAIYLTGCTQVITGLGTFLLTPVIGDLSDKYGRKAMLTLPMTLGILPLVILAFGRSAPFFYAYYIIKMLAGMFCDGSMQCLTLAYVADKICVTRRISAFGVLSGISTAGFVSATISARVLPTAVAFQVSASVAVVAAVYMRFFLVETDGGAALADESSGLLHSPPSDVESHPKLSPLGEASSLVDMVRLFRSSSTLSRVAVVTFIDSLGTSGYHASITYFLKAKFHFGKDQYADIMLIIGVAGTLSQLLLMPALAPAVGEEILLSVGLLASCAHIFLTSISWSSWVPYFSATLTVLSVFGQPCLRTIVSKNAGPNEQGLAQGGFTGVGSIASIISPFVFTPLTALFLSEKAPFDFKGFSLMCGGFACLIAFTLSVTIKSGIAVLVQKFGSGNTAAV